MVNACIWRKKCTMVDILLYSVLISFFIIYLFVKYPCCIIHVSFWCETNKLICQEPNISLGLYLAGASCYGPIMMESLYHSTVTFSGKVNFILRPKNIQHDSCTEFLLNDLVILKIWEPRTSLHWNICMFTRPALEKDMEYYIFIDNC